MKELTPLQSMLIDYTIHEIKRIINKVDANTKHLQSEAPHSHFMANLCSHCASSLLAIILLNLKQEEWKQTIDKIAELAIKDAESIYKNDNVEIKNMN